jgi:hypothetical protein
MDCFTGLGSFSWRNAAGELDWTAAAYPLCVGFGQVVLFGALPVAAQ